jgi:DNA-binding response OmpR family regulator
MAETPQVLVVDDDQEARLLIARMLEAPGYGVTGAAEGEEALALLRNRRFDLVLLDVVLPDVDGFECCRRIRDLGAVPLIVVSALADTRSIVRGLEAGADDYVAKPFEREELLARIGAVRRRCARVLVAPAPLSLPTLQVGPLRLEFSTQLASLGDVGLELSGKEFLLLHALAARVGCLLSRALLFEEVWRGDVLRDSKTLDVHISRLRKKLNGLGGYGDLLKTIRNRGYLLSAEMQSAPPPSPRASDG